jgi:hypothetical protein
MKLALTPCFGLALLALSFGAGARGDDGSRSPFLPPNATGAASGGTVDPNAMQLRGIMATSDGMKYNIYDPAKKSSVWVGVNESGNGFLIKSADLRREAVTVAANGQQTTLALKEAKIQSPAANGVPQGGAVLRPTPADEQVRLQAVADEVRRRRLLREQAATGQLGQPSAQSTNGQPQGPGHNRGAMNGQNGAVNPDGSRRQ